MQSTFREHSSWPCCCCSTRRPAEQLTAQVGLFLCLTSLLWVCVVSIQSQTCTSCTNSCRFAFRFPFCEQFTLQTSLHAPCEQNTSHGNFALFRLSFCSLRRLHISLYLCSQRTWHFAERCEQFGLQDFQLCPVVYDRSEQCTSHSAADSSVRKTANRVPLTILVFH